MVRAQSLCRLRAMIRRFRPDPPACTWQADMGLAERLVEKGEAKLTEYQHPDPYIVPYYPGGVARTWYGGACIKASAFKMMWWECRWLALRAKPSVSQGAAAASQLGPRGWTLSNPECKCQGHPCVRICNTMVQDGRIASYGPHHRIHVGTVSRKHAPLPLLCDAEKLQSCPSHDMVTAPLAMAPACAAAACPH